MTRDELIVALEVATGPSHYLDEEIMRCVYAALQLELHMEGWYTPDGTHVRVEPYTASIDAALTLVPETDGKRWYEIGRAWSSATARVRVYPPNPWDGRTREAVADAPTPALALCIAALKARAP